MLEGTYSLNESFKVDLNVGLNLIISVGIVALNANNIYIIYSIGYDSGLRNVLGFDIQLNNLAKQLYFLINIKN